MAGSNGNGNGNGNGGGSLGFRILAWVFVLMILGESGVLSALIDLIPVLVVVWLVMAAVKACRGSGGAPAGKPAGGSGHAWVGAGSTPQPQSQPDPNAQVPVNNAQGVLPPDAPGRTYWAP